MIIEIPDNVSRIIQKLMDNEFEAFAVGGCVRDSLLGRSPDDWDITTSARPGQVKGLFLRTIDTGLQHGTVTVMIKGEGFEVTTYRIDGEYEDSRHPREVIFTPDLTEDLKRRDFTINAMAYNHRAGLIDYFNGVEDLGKKIVRCVGDPVERFREDALRILRAVRFSAQLGFAIDDGTRKAIRLLAPTLSNISAERIQVELVKLLVSDQPEVIRTAWETGITQVILPEFDLMMNTKQNNPHHKYTVGEHTLHALARVPCEKVLRLTILFHDIGKPKARATDAAGVDHFICHNIEGEKIAHQILRRLKFDNDTINKVTRLIKYHDYHLQAAPATIRRAVHKIGADIFPLLLKIQLADILAQSSYHQQEKLDLLERTEAVYNEIIRTQQCISLKDLAVSGSDLVEMGIPAGPDIGTILSNLLSQVLEEPGRNTKDYLLGIAVPTLLHEAQHIKK